MAINCLFQDLRGNSAAEYYTIKVFDVEHVFKKIDKNNDGTIDLSEFKVIVSCL